MKFSSIGNAKKQTGLSYLGSVNSSAKIKKGKKYGEDTYILYLAPADQSGYNVCPMSTKECRQACLVGSGKAKMDTKNIIHNARIKKTKLFFEQREFFVQWLVAEISSAKKRAEQKGNSFSVRLNGTSDISPELFKTNGKNILELFPDVMFYDYTKVANRTRLLSKYKNYDITFSYSGSNLDQCIELLENSIARVAIVFSGKTLPLLWKGFPVIDGDKYDMRYQDPQGCVVGLTFKQVKEKFDIAKNKFIIPADSPDNVFV